MSVNTTVPCPNTVHHLCHSPLEKVVKFLVGANRLGNKYNSDSDSGRKEPSTQPWLHTVDITAGKSIRWSMPASLLYWIVYYLCKCGTEQHYYCESWPAGGREEKLCLDTVGNTCASCEITLTKFLPKQLAVKLKGDRLPAALYTLLIKLLLQHLCESPLQRWGMQSLLVILYLFCDLILGSLGSSMLVGLVCIIITSRILFRTRCKALNLEFSEIEKSRFSSNVNVSWPSIW